MELTREDDALFTLLCAMLGTVLIRLSPLDQ